MTPEALQELSGVHVSRETLRMLETYVDLIEKWTKRINLVSKTTLAEIWKRHIADSLQMMSYCPDEAKTWVDLGSGGGFPGMVCAIYARGEGRDIAFTLVDSDARKMAFLATVKAQLGLKVELLIARAESIPVLSPDVVSARALAPLPKLLTLSHSLFGPHTLGLFQKGAAFEAEIEAARAMWRFKLTAEQSRLHPESVILLIEDLHRA